MASSENTADHNTGSQNQDAIPPQVPANESAHRSTNIVDVKIRYEDTHFVDSTKPVWNYSLFNEEVINNFQQGTLYNAYQFFGNKQIEVLGTPGTYFAVWAPNATMPPGFQYFCYAPSEEIVSKMAEMQRFICVG